MFVNSVPDPFVGVPWPPPLQRLQRRWKTNAAFHAALLRRRNRKRRRRRRSCRRRLRFRRQRPLEKNLFNNNFLQCKKLCGNV